MGQLAPSLFLAHVDPGGTLVLRGQICIATADDVRARIDEIILADRRVVLDMSQVSFMDSTGLHVLIEASSASGRPVVIKNASGPVERLLGLAASLDLGLGAWILEGQAAPSPAETRS